MLGIYRPNAAVIVTDGKGRVLLCQRLEEALKKHWQVVQGGIDEGETAREAAVRELQEELGISPESFDILAESRETYKYDWTPEYLAAFPPKPLFKKYIGQEQRYFLALYKGDLADINLDAHGREFAQVKWGTAQELVAGAWDGKKPGIRAALGEFGLLAEEL